MIRTLLIMIVFSVTLNSCDNSAHKPIIGDIYKVQIDSLIFTTWKITKVKSRKIWYIPNDYQVSTSQYADSINVPDNYTDFPKKIMRKEFKKSQLEYINPKTD